MLLRVLNIEHISHAMPYAVVFVNICICLYVEKAGLLVIVVMTVELITFICYTCARYGHMDFGVRNTFAISYG